jgi:hypothetical protein
MLLFSWNWVGVKFGVHGWVKQFCCSSSAAKLDPLIFKNCWHLLDHAPDNNTVLSVQKTLHFFGIPETLDEYL